MITPYAKAAIGALLAGLTALGTALADDNVTALEWVGVAVAALGTATGVWAVPNRPAVKPPPLNDARHRYHPPTDKGAFDLGTALQILMLVFLTLAVLILIRELT